GGAYVPLDPDYPRERLHFMLEDSQAPVLLTQSFLRKRLPELPAKVMCLDEAGTFQEQPGGNPDRRGGPEDLAYVIYTSGSTGRPKGVMVSHLSISNHTQWMQSQFGFTAQDKILQKTPFSFDASIWEFYTPLATGATLVMALPDQHGNTGYLHNILNEQNITVLQVVPSLLKAMLDDGSLKSTGLRCLFCGGEPLAIDIKQNFYKQQDAAALYNLYGPTEATIDATWYYCAPDIETISIGHPIANTQIHILDACCQPLPIGIPGELCIAGAGLARVYLNRPGLTAEKFIEIELFGKLQRICKTGDLARRLPDGCLEYLGRIDHQVKLRGFRIELGEIEAVLSLHETVKEAVVNLHEREGNPSLAAYVTTAASDEQPAAGDSSLAADLRDYLKNRLPDYMIPVSFTVLDKLPLTPNGKIDRKALPEPEAVSSTEQVVPRTETEALLATLWSAVLKTEVTSSAAGFFDLGGHSLLATQLASRIRDGFGVDMPLRILFEHPILGDLAAWLDQQQCSDTLPPIMAQPQDTPLVLSHAQQRLWFLAQLEGQSAAYNMPAALKLSGTLNSEALRQTFLALVERHQSLRLCFPEQDGEAAVQVIPVYDPLTVTDLTPLPESEQQAELRHLIQTHASQPFDLASGPLLRLRLLTLDDRAQVLLFNM
ncbi:MAG: amino acid adenylation domain-containing protein, partial [Gammaproteobacteria bacterium]|nr:amino acid adenylation domain-containing protein [Gammaproteobacteria bacterium]